MELAMMLTALSSAAVVCPWLVAVAGRRHAGGGSPPGRHDYTLAA